MPLLITPYTLGTQLGVAAATPTGGVSYYVRRKRFIAYILSSIILFWILG